MLNIVCVKWGTLYGPEYVNILYDMVRRNIKDGTPGKFVCFTDDPTGLHEDIETRELPGNLTGWWNKIYLFKDGLFPKGDRILYLDLDTVIVSSLDNILTYDGEFAILRDFYRPNGYGSAIMTWIAGKYNEIWEKYVAAGYPSIDGGDQAWLERMAGKIFEYKVREGYEKLASFFRPDILQDLYPNAFVSYKAHCKDGIPKGAKLVCFHGVPNPCGVLDGWVPRIWKIGGGSSLEIVVEGNTELNTIRNNIREALQCNLSIADGMAEAHEYHAVLVGGAPSIKGEIHQITRHQEAGHHIIALNNSWRWLRENHINPLHQVMIDAREENVDFVPENIEGMHLLYATQCHPKVIRAMKGRGSLWHALIPGIVDDFPDKSMFWIGSGTTVGIRAILLMYVRGYRHFHIYGYDSCYAGEEGHAYPQELNDKETIIEVVAGDRTFKAAPWMVTQTEEFLQLMEHLTKEGCEFTIHGDGLLQYAVKTMLIPEETGNVQGDIAEYSGVWWPTADATGRGYITAAMGDIEGMMSYVKRRNICVQAGGNVGMWPKEFAKHFETVYTFEPDNINFQCLVRNCPEPNIIKMQAALGDDVQQISLVKNEKNCGAHSVGSPGVIPVLCIDDLWLEDCDLIQLDIEGYELKALEGALATIQQFGPTIIIEENGLGERYGAKIGAIAEFLAPYGYREVARFHRDIVFVHNSK